MKRRVLTLKFLLNIERVEIAINRLILSYIILSDIIRSFNYPGYILSPLIENNVDLSGYTYYLFVTQSLKTKKRKDRSREL